MQIESLFEIANEVKEILLAEKSITDIVGDQIFPLFAKDSAKGDFILYKRERYSIDRTKTGDSLQKVEIYVNVVTDRYTRSVELAKLIYQTLSGEFSNPEMQIRMEDSTEEYESGKYIQVLLFSIEIYET